MKQIIVVTLCLISIHTQAQKRSMQFSIAAEAAVMATEQAYKVYNLGFGGSGKVLYPTGERDYFTGSVGVIAFSGRSGSPNKLFDVPVDIFNLSNYNIAHPSLTILPIKVGYKHFVTSKFNLEAEGGYTVAWVKKFETSYPGDIGGYVFSGGFGFLIAKKMDIGMRYELFETTASRTNYTSYVGLRTLLMLDFRK